MNCSCAAAVVTVTSCMHTRCVMQLKYHAEHRTVVEGVHPAVACRCCSVGWDLQLADWSLKWVSHSLVVDNVGHSCRLARLGVAWRIRRMPGAPYRLHVHVPPSKHVLPWVVALKTHA